MKPVLYAGSIALVVFAGFVGMLLMDGAPETVTSRPASDDPEPPADAGNGDPEPPPASERPPAERPQPAADHIRRFRSPAEPPATRPRLGRGNSRLLVETVTPAGSPLAGVAVMLRSGLAANEAVTDKRGEALFDAIAHGTYTMRLAPPDRPELVSANHIVLDRGEDKRLRVRVGDFDLRISGYVRETTGVAVPGIVVEAVRAPFEADTNLFVPWDQSGQRAVTGADGHYEISGLDEGEYDLRTVATDVYPVVRLSVRAGVESADLTVDRGQVLTVSGKVVGASGEPLAGVLVVPRAQVTQQVETAGDGTYEMEIVLTRLDRTHVIGLSREGYREKNVYINAEDVEGLDSWQLDVGMEPVGRTVRLVGRIAGSDGQPLPDEMVRLHSATTHATLQARSDAQGVFRFDEVPAAADYKVWVYPAADFRDFTRKSFAIVEEETRLDIVLEPVEFAVLRGRIVDIDGNPVPRFNLWLKPMESRGQRFSIVSSDDGRFVLERVPVGELFFDTRSYPRISIRGVHLASATASEEVDLLVDWGEFEMRGTVVDEEQQAVAGARVDLYHESKLGSVTSQSHRKTTTDANGHFHFTQLGRGLHRLKTSAKGFQGVLFPYEVGSGAVEPTVELKRLETTRP